MNEYKVIKCFKKIPTLKTERLVLRRLMLNDYRDMYEYTCRHEVTKYLMWHEHENTEQT